MGANTGDFIEVVGARQNNLKGINLKLPSGDLIVITARAKTNVIYRHYGTGSVLHFAHDRRNCQRNVLHEA